MTINNLEFLKTFLARFYLPDCIMSVLSPKIKKSLRGKYLQTRGFRNVDSVRFSCFNFQCRSGGLVSDRLVLIKNGNQSDVNIALSEFLQVITTRRAHTPLSDCSLLGSSSASLLGFDGNPENFY